MPSQNMTLFDMPESLMKEAFVYSDLFRFLDEVQDQADIPLKDRLITPKVYEADPEYIMLEDLVKRGFSTLDRRVVITFDFAKFSFEALAKLHAFTFVLQEKRPDLFREKIVNWNKVDFENEYWVGFINNMNRLAVTCLDAEAKEKVERYIPTTFAKYRKYAQDTKMTRCLAHGDFKSVNVMYKSENGVIIDLLPVDFQTMYYGCPIIDFLFFIFTASDSEFRRNHLEALKDVYHDTMTNYLKYFNIDVNKYLSRADFEKMYKEKLDYGLMLGLWYIPMALAEDGDVGDITNMDLSEVKFKFTDAAKTRVRGIVQDFIEWGYL